MVNLPPDSTQLTGSVVRELAAECGFDLAGVAAAGPAPDFGRYRAWVDAGMAGEMRYLTDHRADLRADPAELLPGLQSVISVGMLYSGPEPCSVDMTEPERAWVSRYAWGDDYHDLMRGRLKKLAHKLCEIRECEWRACVDTAPLLERSLARQAGLGWIGKNTCLIREGVGSWFFLGELLTTAVLQPDLPPPDRCGTCTRCIDACPTAALTPYQLDARLCISYFTIELRGMIPENLREGMGANIFGCDICQDVCPWNRKAVQTREAAFAPRDFAPDLEKLGAISEAEFQGMFRSSPVTRAKYAGFLRNVAVAMGNSGLDQFREPLRRMAEYPNAVVAEHARWALSRLSGLEQAL